MKINFSCAVRVDLITIPGGKTFVTWRAKFLIYTVNKVKVLKQEALLSKPGDLEKTIAVLSAVSMN